MTLLQFVEKSLPKEFIDYQKIRPGDHHLVYIKEEYQVEANTKYLRSQAFTSKLTPEQKLEYPFAPKGLQCKIELFALDDNDCIWAIDTTNEKCQRIHIDNLNNYDN